MVAGQSASRCTKTIVRAHVTKDLCADVNIVAHVVAGKGQGPTVLLLSMLHGNEWFFVLILRELIARLNPMTLRDNVIAIPVANPAAMSTASRCLLDDSDEPDANRAFGGPYNWLSNQIARTIAETFFPCTDYLVDYDVSDWGSTMAYVPYVEDYSNSEVGEKSRAMAMAFGFPVVHQLRIFSGLRGARTSLGHTGEHYEIPGIVAEVGGLGFGSEQERAWLETNVRGTIGVMHHLQMLDGAPVPCARRLLIRDYWRVGPTVGGYLEPVVGLDRQFTEVAKDELLARVVSPTTFEVLEEVRSPGRGTIFYSCRAHMVRPGAQGFGVANMEDGQSRWVPE